MIAWLVETLVVTTGLMLLVLLIRDPVRRTFGSHAAYALWALPALRMILPPLGAFLPAGIPVGAVTHTSGAMANLVETQIVVQMVADTAPALSGTGSASAAAGSNWPLLIAGLWAIGLAVFAVHHYLAYRRFCGFILSEATLREELAPGVTLVSSPARSWADGLRPAPAVHRFPGGCRQALRRRGTRHGAGARAGPSCPRRSRRQCLRAGHPDAALVQSGGVDRLSRLPHRPGNGLRRRCHRRRARQPSRPCLWPRSGQVGERPRVHRGLQSHHCRSSETETCHVVQQEPEQPPPQDRHHAGPPRWC